MTTLLPIPVEGTKFGKVREIGRTARLALGGDEVMFGEVVDCDPIAFRHHPPVPRRSEFHPWQRGKEINRHRSNPDVQLGSLAFEIFLGEAKGGKTESGESTHQ